MGRTRFFVANLLPDTKKRHLRNLFKKYGEVINIELKTKENPIDPRVIKIIAFVTLKISADNVKYCLNELNCPDVNGQNIQVSLAKESFLERLKREREEAKAVVDNTLPPIQQSQTTQSDLLKTPSENKRKIFDINGELDDDEVSAELMITKKRAASSMHNGKIVIQSHDVEPIHVIESVRKKKKLLDNKSNSADQKRKESLNKMKRQYQQNKTAIQQALQDLDKNNKSSKRIKFSDAESDQGVLEQYESANKSKKDIFESDDDENDKIVDFTSLPQGRKGEKLAQMQAKQSLDPRFRIDAKFVDDDDDNENDQHRTNGNNINNDAENERQWQMNILEQVVGTKLDKVESANKARKNKKMLRYDPSKDDHQQFERNQDDERNDKTLGQKQGKTKNSTSKESVNAVADPPEVSKEVFYVVTDTLQQSLRTRGEGFSLLKMFGEMDQLKQRDEQLKQLSNEKILVNNNKLEKTFTTNPFTYDSSSESEAEAEEKENDQKNKELEGCERTDAQAEKKPRKKINIVTESFFIPKNDKRLKEGAKFFIYKKSDDATTENYEEVRNRLKLLIKTKITKTKKCLANAGYKRKRKC